MTSTCRLIHTLTIVLACTASIHAAVIVARHGEAAVPIVQAADATTPEQYAAEELAMHLGKITGATFETVAEADLPEDATAIFVGHTRFAAANGIGAAALGPEEWLLRTVGGNLILTGGRPRGTLYAVYEFLERELGVAWLNEDVTLLPEHADLVIAPLNRTGAPAFGTMRFVYTDLRGLNHVPDFIEKMEIFHTRNKVGDGAWLWSKPRYGARMRATAGHSHSFYAYIPPDTYFDEHPEWFSVNVNGQRTRSNGQLCLTNEEMTAEVIRRMRTFIAQDREGAAQRGYPAPVRYELSMNDYHMMCQCTDCRAVVEREEAESGLVLAFVNKVAQAIAEDYPEIEIRTFAYSLTIRPPRHIRPRDNVVMMLAYLADSKTGHSWRCPAKALAHPYHEIHRTATENWRDLDARIRIWDYWRTFAGDPFDTPYTKLNSIQSDMQYLHRLGVADGYFVEYYGAYKLSFFPLTRWLGLKLMDDPYRDVEPLIRRFIIAWYGPAASKMQEWLDYLHLRLAEFSDGLPPTPVYRRTYLDIPFFEKAYEVFARAEAACAPESEALTRVKRERLPVDTALLGLWATLGKRLAEDQTMPWDRATVLDRHAADKKQVVASVHVPQTLSGALRGVEGQVADLGRFTDPPPLPPAFAELPSADVVEAFLPRDGNARHHTVVVDDPAAPGGKAIRLDTGKMGDKPGAKVPVGLYIESTRTFGPSLVFTPATEEGETATWFEQGLKADRKGLRVSFPPDEDYHWYRLGPFPIKPGALLHVHRSWYLGVKLDRPLVLGYPEEEWYVHFALKLQGPAYVEGSARDNAIAVGRVILLRAANPQARDFMP